MTRALPAFPEVYQHTYTAEIGGRALRVRLTWQERTASWYLDLIDADTDEPIATGRRVSGLRAPLHGLGLAGVVGRGEVLVVDGPDPYDRLALGAALRMLLIERPARVPPARPYSVREAS